MGFKIHDLIFYFAFVSVDYLYSSIIFISHSNAPFSSHPCPSGVVQLSGWQPAVPGNVLLAATAPGHGSTSPEPFIGPVGAPQ